MNFLEAIEALKAGKKIRKNTWSNHYIDYIELIDGKIFVHNEYMNFFGPTHKESNLLTTNDFTSNNWVEVKETVKLTSLFGGDEFTLQKGSKEIYIRLTTTIHIERHFKPYNEECFVTLKDSHTVMTLSRNTEVYPIKKG